MQRSLWLPQKGEWWDGKQGRVSCVFLQVCLSAGELFLQVSMAGAGEAELLRSRKSQWMFLGIMGKTDIELAARDKGLGSDFWVVDASANYCDGGLGKGGFGIGLGVKNSAPTAQHS